MTKFTSAPCLYVKAFEEKHVTFVSKTKIISNKEDMKIILRLLALNIHNSLMLLLFYLKNTI